MEWPVRSRIQRREILTLDSGDRTWVASIEKVKRYRKRKPTRQEIIDKEGAAQEESDHLQHLDEIFGTNDSVPRGSSPISIDEFVVKKISHEDPRGSEDDFNEAKRQEVARLQERNLWRVV